MHHDADGSEPKPPGVGNRSEPGPRYREYALVLVAIAIVGAVALALFGGQTSHVLSVVSPAI